MIYFRKKDYRYFVMKFLLNIFTPSRMILKILLETNVHKHIKRKCNKADLLL